MVDTRLRLAAVGLCLSLIGLALVVVSNKSIDPRFFTRDSVTVSAPAPRANVPLQEEVNYTILRRRIAYGEARLFDVLQALTEPDVRGLANTVHALYSMRIQRGVLHALEGLWIQDRDKYPKFAWEEASTPTVRIAIASTLNRVKIVETNEYLSFIRAHKYDDEPFNRAQVAVALGFNGSREDLAYLEEMADQDNHYVAQSAITALSLVGGNAAREILIKLNQKHAGTARGRLIGELLQSAYGWPPAELNPLSPNS